MSTRVAGTSAGGGTSVRPGTRGPGRPEGGPGGALGRPVEKAKDFRGTLRRLLAYLKPHHMRLLAVAVFAIGSTVFSVAGPKLMGQATTKIFNGVEAKLIVAGKDKAFGLHISLPKIDFAGIGHILLWLIALYLVSSILSFIQQYMMAGIAQKTVYTLRQDVDAKLARLPLEYFDGRTHGEILSLVTNDIDTISTTLQQNMTQLITSLVTIAGVIVMMLSISVALTGIVIVTLPLYIVVTMVIARRSQRYFASQQGELAAISGHVEEMYTGHVVVKAFGHEAESIETFDQINDRLYAAGWRAQFISGIIMPLMNFVSNIGYVIISVVGGIMVTKNQIAVGDIQAFIQYSQQFTQPIIQTANIANVIQSTIACAERVFALLDESEEPADSVEAVVLEHPRGEIEVRDVTFAYVPDQPLIENMNITTAQGQSVAIVGPTGAGKTTLVNLLMRFYEVQAGQITVDGVDIHRMRRGDLRRMFGMVLQDTWLFHGTVRENIGYGKEHATEDEIVSAAVAAHADHFIRTLPDGYDTVLNEEASNISQGQKQLLTIARAFLHDPAILILDEATSSVDSRTEVLIQAAMAQLMQNRTSFVIAHRLSTIRDAQTILVMNHGRIIEQGNHRDLLAQKGFYADLHNSQFTGRAIEEPLHA